MASYGICDNVLIKCVDNSMYLFKNASEFTLMECINELSNLYQPLYDDACNDFKNYYVGFSKKAANLMYNPSELTVVRVITHGTITYTVTLIQGQYILNAELNPYCDHIFNENHGIYKNKLISIRYCRICNAAPLKHTELSALACDDLEILYTKSYLYIYKKFYLETNNYELFDTFLKRYKEDMRYKTSVFEKQKNDELKFIGVYCNKNLSYFKEVLYLPDKQYKLKFTGFFGDYRYDVKLSFKGIIYINYYSITQTDDYKTLAKNKKIIFDKGKTHVIRLSQDALKQRINYKDVLRHIFKPKT